MYPKRFMQTKLNRLEFVKTMIDEKGSIGLAHNFFLDDSD
jgi:hypothetical protein